MSKETKIQWCDYTWSPWLGCRKVSPGCENCYITTTTPFRVRKIEHGSRRERTSESYWRQPLAWNRKAAKDGTRPKVFPSLCDPFDEEVDPIWREDFFDLIEATPCLIWLLLTKRLEKARTYLDGDAPNNLWLGGSVEDQKRADERIPILLSIPAKVRFLSVEPMLEKIDLSEWLNIWGVSGPGGETECTGIEWVIFGGESGTGARPCHFDWIRRGVKQCKDAGVAAFVKQAGSCVHEFAEYAHCHLPDAWPRQRTVRADGDCMVRILLEHPKGGDPSEWPKEQRVREFPNL